MTLDVSSCTMLEEAARRIETLLSALVQQLVLLTLTVLLTTLFIKGQKRQQADSRVIIV